MERVRKPRVHRESREAEIVDAAIRCVLRSGFHGTPMDAIAREAGLSVGVIYRYFPSKEAIIEAIVTRDLDDLRTKVANTAGPGVAKAGHDDPEGLRGFVERQHNRTRSALRLEIYAEAARNPKVEAVVRRAAEVERDLVRQLLLRYLPADTPGADLAGRADVMRIIADGLLVNGLYAGADSIGHLLPRLHATLTQIFSPKPEA